MKITAKTRVNEALALSKNIAPLFQKYQLACAGCKGAENETIEKLAVNNGLDVALILEELNAALKG